MQLTGKKVSTAESDVTAKEEEQSESESESESEVEDTAPEVNTVAGLVQVFRAFLRPLLACVVVLGVSRHSLNEVASKYDTRLPAVHDFRRRGQR